MSETEPKKRGFFSKLFGLDEKQRPQEPAAPVVETAPAPEPVVEPVAEPESERPVDVVPELPAEPEPQPEAEALYLARGYTRLVAPLSTRGEVYRLEVCPVAFVKDLSD